VAIASHVIERKTLGTRIDAEDLFLQAQKLRASPTAKPVQDAIELFRNARKKWATIADQNGQALAFSAEADGWLALSRYQDAFRSIAAARQLANLDASSKLILYNVQTRIDLDLWDSASAQRDVTQAMALVDHLGDHTREAETLANRGEARFLLTSDVAAATDLTAALTLTRDNGDRVTVARILRCQAWIEEDQGHLTQAIGLMQRAEEMFRYVGQIRDSLGAVSDIALFDGLTGDHFGALLTHSRVADVIYQTGQLSNYGFVLNTIGTDYEGLNRPADAAAYLERSERIFSSIHNTSGEMSSLGQLCPLELQLNRLGDALNHCQKAVALSKLALDPKRQAIAEWRLGRVYERMGNLRTALAAFTHAATMSEGVQDARYASLALLDAAEVSGRLGNEESELRAYQKALMLSTSAEDATTVTEAQFQIAHFYAGHHDPDKATSMLNELLGSIERQRLDIANDELRGSYFTIVRKCYALYVDVLMEEHEHSPEKGLDRRALEMSEAGRARTLLDSANGADRVSNDPPDTASERVAQLRASIDQVYDERLKLMLTSDRPQEMRQNSAQLRQLINDYDRQSDLIKYPSRSQAPPPKPLTADELREATQSSDYVFFEYALGERRSYLWVMDHGSIETHILPGKAQISSSVTKWNELVSSHSRRDGEEFAAYLKRVDASDRELPRAASELSCMLLCRFLKPQMKRVAIVADGILQNLSFSALPADGCDSRSGLPALAEHEIVNIPSVSVLTMAKHDRRLSPFKGDLAVLADPVFDEDDPRVVRSATYPAGRTPSRTQKPSVVFGLPRLMATRQEALSISSLLPPERVLLAMDFDASVKTVLTKDVSDYRILHLATHGVFDQASPELSGLVLSLFDSRGRSVHGFITAHELSDMKMRSDLVVLSSCDSGLGESADEEGARGLAFSLLRAGAGNVISTLWKIDDDVSSRLMVSLYEHLLKSNETPAEALRQAQLEIKKSGRTAHPFYWAGFVITSGTQ
jgi:tetratricopeptide (TPR) repeat protein